jgi:hypothetical protein
MWNNIEEFTEWYLANGCPMKPPATDPIYETDHSLSCIVFREGRYQVELYMLAPNWATPNHGHPGIEYRIVILNGTIGGTKNNEYVNDSSEWADRANPDGTNVLFGMSFDFESEDYHQVSVGPKGGLIAITQKWDEGLAMSSQSVQYVGDPIGPHHETRIAVNKAE